MTSGQKISQGSLQETLLCSEASSIILNGAINNKKAINFYSSFGLNFGPWKSQIYFFVCVGFKPFTSDFFANTTVPKKQKWSAKFPCPQNKTQTWIIISWLTAVNDLSSQSVQQFRKLDNMQVTNSMDYWMLLQMWGHLCLRQETSLNLT